MSMLMNLLLWRRPSSSSLFLPSLPPLHRTTGRSLFWFGFEPFRIPSGYCHSGCDAVNVSCFTHPAKFQVFFLHGFVTISTAHTHFAPLTTGLYTIIYISYAGPIFRYFLVLANNQMHVNISVFFLIIVHGLTKALRGQAGIPQHE